MAHSISYQSVEDYREKGKEDNRPNFYIYGRSSTVYSIDEENAIIRTSCSSESTNM